MEDGQNQNMKDSLKATINLVGVGLKFKKLSRQGPSPRSEATPRKFSSTLAKMNSSSPVTPKILILFLIRNRAFKNYKFRIALIHIKRSEREEVARRSPNSHNSWRWLCCNSRRRGKVSQLGRKSKNLIIN